MFKRHKQIEKAMRQLGYARFIADEIGRSFTAGIRAGIVTPYMNSRFAESVRSQCQGYKSVFATIDEVHSYRLKV